MTSLRTYLWMLGTLLSLLLVMILLSSFLERPDTRSELTGRIYLTAVTPDTAIPGPHVLDVGTDTFLLEGASDESVGMFHSFSNDGQYVAFVGTTVDEMERARQANRSFGEALQVYADTTLPSDPLPLPRQASRMTYSPLLLKSAPSISTQGTHVAFVGSDGTAEEESLETSDIYILNRETKEMIRIAQGIHPTWAPDATLVYIAQDGIRAYSIVHGESVLMIAANGTMNMKLDISDDGRFMAWAVPDARTVYVFTVGSWQAPAGTVAEAGATNFLGYWVRFSPDGRYLAVQTANEDGSKPRVVLFSADTLEQMGAEFSLNGFVNERLFMTDWR